MSLRSRIAPATTPAISTNNRIQYFRVELSFGGASRSNRDSGGIGGASRKSCGGRVRSCASVGAIRSSGGGAGGTLPRAVSRGFATKGSGGGGTAGDGSIIDGSVATGEASPSACQRWPHLVHFTVRPVGPRSSALTLHLASQFGQRSEAHTSELQSIM